ncbi:nuclear transport factor 2 family protein [Isoptericola rhizosphaerae]|uniref:nuclear transport factor 2 family protein n=1 Tax=Isoptericola rhizosphaerae TaxID=3377837 RepID=UPI00383A104A
MDEAMLHELLAIDDRLARGAGPDYAEVLHDDALVVVPGAVLDKAGCVAAMDASPGWDEADLDDARLVRGGDTATIVYRFTGRRGEDTYVATLASTYVCADGWRLLLHQHTPD